MKSRTIVEQAQDEFSCWFNNSDRFNPGNLDYRLVRSDERINISARFQRNCQLERIEGSSPFAFPYLTMSRSAAE